MWLALLLFSSASGLVLWLARLKVFALIPATMIFALFAVSGGIALLRRYCAQASLGHDRLHRNCQRNNIAGLLSDRWTSIRGSKPASGPVHNPAT